MGAVKLEKRHAYPSGGRKKRGRRLIIAYALRGSIFLVLTIMIALMVCGVLYIKEHLAHTSDRKLHAGNTEADDNTPSGTSIISAIPEKVTVVLDAGHGGEQPGCVINDVMEKDITLSIVLLLQEKLESEGVTVILTRDADEDVSLSRRSEIANSVGANYFVSIHCNSYEEDLSVKGFECYYYQSDESKELAKVITLSADNHLISTRKVKEENYIVLRDTVIPAVLIEVGFMTNEQERAQLLSPEYQELLAETIANGILNYNSKL